MKASTAKITIFIALLIIVLGGRLWLHHLALKNARETRKIIDAIREDDRKFYEEMRKQRLPE